LEKIFSFGFTTTAGSGIGLYHVKQIVDNMNGSVSVKSEVKKGAKIIISLKNAHKNSVD
jgi:signal transduction histidine kinase